MVRFSLYGVTVCLVNSHLASDDDKLTERIKDYEQIILRHEFKGLAKQEIFQHEYVENHLLVSRLASLIFCSGSATFFGSVI